MFSLANSNLDLVQRGMVAGGYTGENFASRVTLILNAKTTVAKCNELHHFKVLPHVGLLNVHGVGWISVGDFGKL